MHWTRIKESKYTGDKETDYTESAQKQPKRRGNKKTKLAQLLQKLLEQFTLNVPYV